MVLYEIFLLKQALPSDITDLSHSILYRFETDSVFGCGRVHRDVLSECRSAE